MYPTQCVLYIYHIISFWHTPYAGQVIQYGNMITLQVCAIWNTFLYWCLAFLHIASYLCDRHIKTKDGSTPQKVSSVRTADPTQKRRVLGADPTRKRRVLGADPTRKRGVLGACQVTKCGSLQRYIGLPVLDIYVSAPPPPSRISTDSMYRHTRDITPFLLIWIILWEEKCTFMAIVWPLAFRLDNFTNIHGITHIHLTYEMNAFRTLLQE